MHIRNYCNLNRFPMSKVSANKVEKAPKVVDVRESKVALYAPFYDIKASDRDMFIDLLQPASGNEGEVLLVGRIALSIAAADELADSIKAVIGSKIGSKK